MFIFYNQVHLPPPLLILDPPLLKKRVAIAQFKVVYIYIECLIMYFMTKTRTSIAKEQKRKYNKDDLQK